MESFGAAAAFIIKWRFFACFSCFIYSRKCNILLKVPFLLCFSVSELVKSRTARGKIDRLKALYTPLKISGKNKGGKITPNHQFISNQPTSISCSGSPNNLSISLSSSSSIRCCISASGST